ncbi:hypothetical protein OROGR_018801 [Orobanche gracilis]
MKKRVARIMFFKIRPSREILKIRDGTPLKAGEILTHIKSPRNGSVCYFCSKLDVLSNVVQKIRVARILFFKIRPSREILKIRDGTPLEAGEILTYIKSPRNGSICYFSRKLDVPSNVVQKKRVAWILFFKIRPSREILKIRDGTPLETGEILTYIKSPRNGSVCYFSSKFDVPSNVVQKIRVAQILFFKIRPSREILKIRDGTPLEAGEILTYIKSRRNGSVCYFSSKLDVPSNVVQKIRVARILFFKIRPSREILKIRDGTPLEAGEILTHIKSPRNGSVCYFSSKLDVPSNVVQKKRVARILFFKIRPSREILNFVMLDVPSNVVQKKRVVRILFFKIRPSREILKIRDGTPLKAGEILTHIKSPRNGSVCYFCSKLDVPSNVVQKIRVARILFFKIRPSREILKIRDGTPLELDVPSNVVQKIRVARILFFKIRPSREILKIRDGTPLEAGEILTYIKSPRNGSICYFSRKLDVPSNVVQKKRVAQILFFKIRPSREILKNRDGTPLKVGEILTYIKSPRNGSVCYFYSKLYVPSNVIQKKRVPPILFFKIRPSQEILKIRDTPSLEAISRNFKIRDGTPLEAGEILIYIKSPRNGSVCYFSSKFDVPSNVVQKKRVARIMFFKIRPSREILKIRDGTPLKAGKILTHIKSPRNGSVCYFSSKLDVPSNVVQKIRVARILFFKIRPSREILKNRDGTPLKVGEILTYIKSPRNGSVCYFYSKLYVPSNVVQKKRVPPILFFKIRPSQEILKIRDTPSLEAGEILTYIKKPSKRISLNFKIRDGTPLEAGEILTYIKSPRNGSVCYFSSKFDVPSNVVQKKRVARIMFFKIRPSREILKIRDGTPLKAGKILTHIKSPRDGSVCYFSSKLDVPSNVVQKIRVARILFFKIRPSREILKFVMVPLWSKLDVPSNVVQKIRVARILFFKIRPSREILKIRDGTPLKAGKILTHIKSPRDGSVCYFSSKLDAISRNFKIRDGTPLEAGEILTYIKSPRNGSVCYFSRKLDVPSNVVQKKRVARILFFKIRPSREILKIRDGTPLEAGEILTYIKSPRNGSIYYFSRKLDVPSNVVQKKRVSRILFFKIRPSREILKICDGTLLKTGEILTYIKSPRNGSVCYFCSKLDVPSNVVQKIRVARILFFKIRPSREILKIRDGTPLEAGEILTYIKSPRNGSIYYFSRKLDVPSNVVQKKRVARILFFKIRPSREILKIRDGTPLKTGEILTYIKSPRNGSVCYFSSKFDVPSNVVQKKRVARILFFKIRPSREILKIRDGTPLEAGEILTYIKSPRNGSVCYFSSKLDVPSNVVQKIRVARILFFKIRPSREILKIRDGTPLEAGEILTYIKSPRNGSVCYFSSKLDVPSNVVQKIRVARILFFKIRPSREILKIRVGTPLEAGEILTYIKSPRNGSICYFSRKLDVPSNVVRMKRVAQILFFKIRPSLEILKIRDGTPLKVGEILTYIKSPRNGSVCYFYSKLYVPSNVVQKKRVAPILFFKIRPSQEILKIRDTPSLEAGEILTYIKKPSKRISLNFKIRDGTPLEAGEILTYIKSPRNGSVCYFSSKFDVPSNVVQKKRVARIMFFKIRPSREILKIRDGTPLKAGEILTHIKSSRNGSVCYFCSKLDVPSNVVQKIRVARILFFKIRPSREILKIRDGTPLEAGEILTYIKSPRNGSIYYFSRKLDVPSNVVQKKRVARILFFKIRPSREILKIRDGTPLKTGEILTYIKSPRNGSVCYFSSKFDVPSNVVHKKRVARILFFKIRPSREILKIRDGTPLEAGEILTYIKSPRNGSVCYFSSKLDVPSNVVQKIRVARILFFKIRPSREILKIRDGTPLEAGEILTYIKSPRNGSVCYFSSKLDVPSNVVQKIRVARILFFKIRSSREILKIRDGTPLEAGEILTYIKSPRNGSICYFSRKLDVPSNVVQMKRVAQILFFKIRPSLEILKIRDGTPLKVGEILTYIKSPRNGSVCYFYSKLYVPSNVVQKKRVAPILFFKIRPSQEILKIRDTPSLEAGEILTYIKKPSKRISLNFKIRDGTPLEAGEILTYIKSPRNGSVCYFSSKFDVPSNVVQKKRVARIMFFKIRPSREILKIRDGTPLKAGEILTHIKSSRNGSVCYFCSKLDVPSNVVQKIRVARILFFKIRPSREILKIRDGTPLEFDVPSNVVQKKRVAWILFFKIRPSREILKIRDGTPLEAGEILTYIKSPRNGSIYYFSRKLDVPSNVVQKKRVARILFFKIRPSREILKIRDRTPLKTGEILTYIKSPRNGSVCYFSSKFDVPSNVVQKKRVARILFFKIRPSREILKIRDGTPLEAGEILTYIKSPRNGSICYFSSKLDAISRNFKIRDGTPLNAGEILTYIKSPRNGSVCYFSRKLDIPSNVVQKKRVARILFFKIRPSREILKIRDGTPLEAGEILTYIKSPRNRSIYYFSRKLDVPSNVVQKKRVVRILFFKIRPSREILKIRDGTPLKTGEILTYIKSPRNGSVCYFSSKFYVPSNVVQKKRVARILFFKIRPSREILKIRDGTPFKAGEILTYIKSPRNGSVCYFSSKLDVPSNVVQKIRVARILFFKIRPSREILKIRDGTPLEAGEILTYIKSPRNGSICYFSRKLDVPSNVVQKKRVAQILFFKIRPSREILKIRDGTPLKVGEILTYIKSPRNGSVCYFYSKLYVPSNVVQKKRVAPILFFKIRPSQEILKIRDTPSLEAGEILTYIKKPSKRISLNFKIRDGTPLEAGGILTYIKKPRNGSVCYFSSKFDVPSNVVQKKRVARIMFFKIRPSREILKIRDGTSLKAGEILTHIKSSRNGSVCYFCSKLDVPSNVVQKIRVARILFFKIRPSREILKIRDGTPLEAGEILTYIKSPRNGSICYFSRKLDVPSNVVQKKRVARILFFKIRPSREILKIRDGTPLEAGEILTYIKSPRNGSIYYFSCKLDVPSNVVQKKRVVRILFFKIRPSREILKIRDGTPLKTGEILTYIKSPRNGSVCYFSSKFYVPSNVVQKKRVARILFFKIRPSREILKIRDGTPFKAGEILTYIKSPRNGSVCYFSSKLDVPSNVVQKIRVARILFFKIRPSREILKIRDGTPLKTGEILTYIKSPRNGSVSYFSSKFDVPSNVVQKKRVARILFFKTRPSREILKIRDGTPLEAGEILTYIKIPRNGSVCYFSSKLDIPSNVVHKKRVARILFFKIRPSREILKFVMLDIPSNVVQKKRVARILFFKIRPSREILKIRDGTPLEAGEILTYIKSPRNGSICYFSRKIDVPSNVVQKKRVARILFFKIRPSREILKIRDGTPLKTGEILTYIKSPRNGSVCYFSSKFDVPSNVVQKKRVARIMFFKIRPSREILKIRDGTPLKAGEILTHKKPSKRIGLVARILFFKIRPSREILKIRDGTPLEAGEILTYIKSPRIGSIYYFSRKLDVPCNVVQKKRVARILFFKIRPSREILKIRDGTPLKTGEILTYIKSPRNGSVCYFSSKFDVPSNVVHKKRVAWILFFKIRPSREILKIRDGTPLEAGEILTYIKSPRNGSICYFSSKLDVPSNVVQKKRVARILFFKIRPSREILKIRDGTPLKAGEILTYIKSPRNGSVCYFSSKFDVPSNVVQKKRVARILFFKIRPSRENLKIRDGTPLEAGEILTYIKSPRNGSICYFSSKLDVPSNVVQKKRVARILFFKIRPSREILKIRDGTPLKTGEILTYIKSPRNGSVCYFSSKFDIPRNAVQKKRVARILFFKIRPSREILKIRDGPLWSKFDVPSNAVQKKRVARILFFKIRPSREILKIRDGTPLKAGKILTYIKSPRNGSVCYFSSKIDVPSNGVQKKRVARILFFKIRPSREILKIRDGTPLKTGEILTYIKSPRNGSVCYFSSKFDVPINAVQKKRVARILFFKIRPSREILKIRDGTPLEAGEILTYIKSPRNGSICYFSSKLDVSSNVVQNKRVARILFFKIRPSREILKFAMKKRVARILFFKIRPSREILKIRDGTPLEAGEILTYIKSPRNGSVCYFSSKLDVPSNVVQKIRVARILFFKIWPSREILKIRDGTPFEAGEILTYIKSPRNGSIFYFSSKLDVPSNVVQNKRVAQILFFKIRPSREILKIRDGTPLKAGEILTYIKSPRNGSVCYFSSKLDVPSNVVQKIRVARILFFKIRPSREILKIRDGTPFEAGEILTYIKNPRNGSIFYFSSKLDVPNNVVHKKRVARILFFKIRPSREILKIRDGTPLKAGEILTYIKSPRNGSVCYFSSKLDAISRNFKIRDGTPLEAGKILTYIKSPRNGSVCYFSSKLDIPSNVVHKKRVARILFFKIRPSREILKIRDGTPLKTGEILTYIKSPRNGSVCYFSSEFDVPSNVVHKKRVAWILFFKIRPSREILKIRDGTPLEAGEILTYIKSPRNGSICYFSSKLDVPSNVVQKKRVARILFFKIRPSREILKIRDGTPLKAGEILTYIKSPRNGSVCYFSSKFDVPSNVVQKKRVARILFFKIRPSRENLKIRDGTPLEAGEILTYIKSPRNGSICYFSSKLDVPSNVVQKKRVARILFFKIRPSREILKIRDGTPLKTGEILTYIKSPRNGSVCYFSSKFDIPRNAVQKKRVARILFFKIRPSREILKIRDGPLWSNAVQKKRVSRILFFKIRPSREILKIRDGTPLKAGKILTYIKSPRNGRKEWHVFCFSKLGHREILKIRDGTPLEAGEILTYIKSPRNGSICYFSSKLDAISRNFKIRDGTHLEAGEILTYIKIPRNGSVCYFSSKLDIPSNVVQKKRVARIMFFKIRPSREILKIRDGTPLEAGEILTYIKSPRNGSVCYFSSKLDVPSNVVQKIRVARILFFKIWPSREILKIRDGTPFEAGEILTYIKSPRNGSIFYFSSKLDVPSNVVQNKRVAQILFFKIRPSREILKIRDGTPLKAGEILTYIKSPRNGSVCYFSSKLDVPSNVVQKIRVTRILFFKIRPSREILKIRDGTPLEAGEILTYIKSPRNGSIFYFSSKLDVPSNVVHKKRVARILFFKIRPSREILKIRDGTPLKAGEILTYIKSPRNGSVCYFSSKLDVPSNVVQNKRVARILFFKIRPSREILKFVMVPLWSKLDIPSNVVHKKRVARILFFKIRPSREILKIRDGTPLKAGEILTYIKSPRNGSVCYFSRKLYVPSNVVQKIRVARILFFKIRPSREILKIRDGTPFEAGEILTYIKSPRNGSIFYFSSKLDVPSNVVQKKRVARILFFKIRPSREILKIRDGTPLKAGEILTYIKSPRNGSVCYFSSKFDVPNNVVHKKIVARILFFKIRPSRYILKIRDGTPLKTGEILTYIKSPRNGSICYFSSKLDAISRNFKIRDGTPLEAGKILTYIKSPRNGSVCYFSSKLDIPSNVVHKKRVARILFFKIRPSREILKIRDGTPLKAGEILTYIKSPRNGSVCYFSSKLYVPSNVVQKIRVARILFFKIRPSREILKIRDGTPFEAGEILTYIKSPRNGSIFYFSSKLDVPSNVVQKKRVARILFFKIRPSREILKIRDGTPLKAGEILTYIKSPRNGSVCYFSSKFDVPNNVVHKKRVARILNFKIRDGTPLEAGEILTYIKSPRNGSVCYFSSKLDIPSNVVHKKRVARILFFKIRPSREILKIRDGTPLKAGEILTYIKSPRNGSVCYFSSKLYVPSNVVQKIRVTRILFFKIRPSREILKIRDGTPFEAGEILTYIKSPRNGSIFYFSSNLDVPSNVVQKKRVARILFFKIRASREILKIRDGTPLKAGEILTYIKSPRNGSVCYFSSKFDVPNNVVQKKRVARILFFKIRPSR